ncbi:hypothetical protein CJT98_28390 [Pseudomonas aeruginosa]|nr:hypothetical protein CJT98_28390 [Pseudomonas aeruginosa]
MRDEFEAWVWDIYEETLWFDLNRESVLKRNGDEYFSNFLNDRWEAWQASRAALRVELPDDGIEDCRRDWQNSCRDNFDTGYCYATDRITQALQQAGIEVK